MWVVLHIKLKPLSMQTIVSFNAFLAKITFSTLFFNYKEPIICNFEKKVLYYFLTQPPLNIYTAIK